MDMYWRPEGDGDTSSVSSTMLATQAHTSFHCQYPISVQCNVTFGTDISFQNVIMTYDFPNLDSAWHYQDLAGVQAYQPAGTHENMTMTYVAPSLEAHPSAIEDFQSLGLFTRPPPGTTPRTPEGLFEHELPATNDDQLPAYSAADPPPEYSPYPPATRKPRIRSLYVQWLMFICLQDPDPAQHFTKISSELLADYYRSSPADRRRLDREGMGTVMLLRGQMENRAREMRRAGIRVVSHVEEANSYPQRRFSPVVPSVCP